MRIAVCDDEIQFMDALCPILEQWAKNQDIPLTLCRFTNGDDLIAAHKSKCMDLIILDVIMPLLNGVDAAREIRGSDPVVPLIFLSSSREFAADSYEVKAFYYLLKPVDSKKLFPVLDEFLRTCQLPESLYTAQTAEGFCKIAFAGVEYLEARNKRVLVRLSDGRSMEIRELFSKCEEAFSPKNGFFRCHRSYIVNLSHVEQFSKTWVLTSHNSKIPISRNSYMAFKEAWFHHMFGEKLLFHPDTPSFNP